MWWRSCSWVDTKLQAIQRPISNNGLSTRRWWLGKLRTKLRCLMLLRPVQPVQVQQQQQVQHAIQTSAHDKSTTSSFTLTKTLDICNFKRCNCNISNRKARIFVLEDCPKTTWARGLPIRLNKLSEVYKAIVLLLNHVSGHLFVLIWVPLQDLRAIPVLPVESVCWCSAYWPYVRRNW